MSDKDSAHSSPKEFNHNNKRGRHHFFNNRVSPTPGEDSVEANDDLHHICLDNLNLFVPSSAKSEKTVIHIEDTTGEVISVS